MSIILVDNLHLFVYTLLAFFFICSLKPPSKGDAAIGVTDSITNSCQVRYDFFLLRAILVICRKLFNELSKLAIEKVSLQESILLNRTD